MRTLRSPPADSGTLSEQLKNGPLPVLTALRYGVDIATALCNLHQKGRVHGGVRPSNIALWGEGAMLKAAQRTMFSSFTAAGDIAGFGATLYEMLTGNPPEAGAAPALPAGAAEALELAQRCMAADATQSPDIYHVRTQARVLLMVARKRKDDPVAEPDAAPEVPDFAKQFPLADLLVEGDPMEKKRAKLGLEEIFTDCPRCHLSRVFSSRPRSWFERLLTRCGVGLCRCHSCGHRFLSLGGVRLRKSTHG